MTDITEEVNFYKKNLLKLDTHYRVKQVSEYMKDDIDIPHECNGLPEAYYCLNSCNSYTKLIRENEANDLIVGEGLIKTYPANKALNIVKKFLKDNLDKELYDLKHEIISAQIKLENTEKQLKMLKIDIMEKEKKIVELETELKKNHK